MGLLDVLVKYAEKYGGIDVYVIRHGKTHFNERGIFTGWIDAHLSNDGINNALQIRKFFEERNIRFDVIFTSDLTRAIQTAQIAYPDYKNAKFIITSLLRERDYGALSGRSKKKFSKEYPMLYRIYHRSYFVPPPGGESFIMMEKRITEFLKFFTKLKAKNVLISAHGNTIRVLARILEKLSYEEGEKIEIEFGKVYHYTLIPDDNFLAVIVKEGVVRSSNEKIGIKLL